MLTFSTIPEPSVPENSRSFASNCFSRFLEHAHARPQMYIRNGICVVASVTYNKSNGTVVSSQDIQNFAV